MVTRMSVTSPSVTVRYTTVRLSAAYPSRGQHAGCRVPERDGRMVYPGWVGCTYAGWYTEWYIQGSIYREVHLGGIYRGVHLGGIHREAQLGTYTGRHSWVHTQGGMLGVLYTMGGMLGVLYTMGGMLGMYHREACWVCTTGRHIARLTLLGRHIARVNTLWERGRPVAQRASLPP